MILFLLEIAFLAGQTYIHTDYTLHNASWYDYGEFIGKIIIYINTKDLDNNYIPKFEAVFYEHWDGAGIYFFFSQIFMLALQFFLWLFSLLGIIFNFISRKNKNNPINLFSYCLIVGIIEVIDNFFGEKSELDLSKSELEQFKEIQTLIETNLNSVKKRILYLRIYSAILTSIYIFHLILSVYIKKSSDKSSKIPLPLENSEKNKLLSN